MSIRKVSTRISGLVTSWRRNSAPRGRRIFHRDVEQEDFQYATTRCLSSYYSVFVARLAIMVMLAILIGLLTILTWHFTKIYTKKSLDTLALGLRYELLQRPIQRMWNILNSTTEITNAHVKLSEYVIKRYNKPATQADQVELYEMMKDITWALFASRKALNAITINYRNGFVHGFHRDHRSNNTFYIYSDLVNYSISAAASGNVHASMLSSHQGWSDQVNSSAIWYREPLDSATGVRIGKPRKIPPDDLINIAGISQVPDGVASWHVSVTKYMDSPLLSAALPVWDPSNETIVAVVGVTTALYSVGQLMKELVEVHGGHIYLTSPEGYLFATSTNAPLLRKTMTGPKLMMAVDSEEPVIRMGAEWLQKAYPNKLPPGHVVHVENAKLGHQQYYIDSFFLNLKRLPMLLELCGAFNMVSESPAQFAPARGGRVRDPENITHIDHVGVIIIPRKFIMGKVDERAVKTLVILISASVCILVIGWVCILILTNGVSKEMNLRAELISHLDARRKAEASSNYKSQFLANMSHELRTPMAAVIGLLDILICDDCLTNEQYSTVTQIRKCSTALLRLLNNILDLSKVESGKLVLEETEFDLGRELEGLVDMFSVQCINHNVETVLDLSDDMPKLVCGDSARVVQIFANLISNSIKFTTSGHVVLRGWCENPNTLNDTGKFHFGQKFGLKTKWKDHGNHFKKACKKENKMILRFEVDDTGCGIDPSKWESVFESFEQADPSTTRLHGGTGLGLCIVRTLINKMGGEIKVVKKNGTGTLMQLYLLLNTPTDSGTEQHFQTEFANHSVVVLLALYGSMSRLIMSKWLSKNRVSTFEASEWNELTQVLRELFQAQVRNTSFDSQSSSQNELLRAKVLNIQDLKNPIFIIVVDIALLDLSTDIWKEQLNYLESFSRKAKFAWMLNHETSNSIKMELRRKGHLLMVNKPLYRAKMVHILETVVNERNLELQKKTLNVGSKAECLEVDSSHFDIGSSDDSDTPGRSSPDSGTPNEEEKITKSSPSQSTNEFACWSSLEDGKPEPTRIERFSFSMEPSQCENSSGSKDKGGSFSSKRVKDLEGLRILLAEDTPVLQRVATIMLEKMGATVIAVGDGLQAVEVLNCRPETLLQNGNPNSTVEIRNLPPIDLVLMDCQMPKMDGYEATKTIRKSEARTNLHIPIVALTAHAMSSDEAKCLEVGMDAYLTKPIDFKLMVSTILSLTRKTSSN